MKLFCVSTGYPVLNTNLYIVSASGALCPKGEVGEACFSGPNVARGYVGGVASDKFVPNTFSSEEGTIRVLRQ